MPLRQKITFTLPTSLLSRPSSQTQPQYGTVRCLHEFSKIKVHRSSPIAFDTMEGYDDPSPVSDAQLSPSNPEADYTELEEGETIQLPDITAPPAASNISLAADKIGGNLTYTPAILQQDPPQNRTGLFGLTFLSNLTIGAPTITRVRGAFNVVATVQADCRFWVRNDDSNNIESAASPKLNSINWNPAAIDLTPAPNNRPPRVQFWARDLTIRHERFHANDMLADGNVGSLLAQKWLQRQTASSVNDIPNLLDQARIRISSFMKSQTQREALALADGAPAYRDRADKIRSVGSSGLYDLSNSAQSQ